MTGWDRRPERFPSPSLRPTDEHAEKAHGDLPEPDYAAPSSVFHHVTVHATVRRRSSRTQP